MTTPGSFESFEEPTTESTAPPHEAPEVPKGTLTVAALPDRQANQAALQAILATLSTLNLTNNRNPPALPLSPVIPTPMISMTSHTAESTKLLDAQILSDSQPSFDNWRIVLSRKLEVNRDRNIAKTNLRDDLYDKLTTKLQTSLARRRTWRGG